MCGCVRRASVLGVLLFNAALLCSRTAAQEPTYHLEDDAAVSSVSHNAPAAPNIIEEEQRLAALQAELEEQLRLGQGGGVAGGEGEGAIPGEPEQDYPVYSQVPRTSFTCADKQVPGYYADIEARCQAFHICSQGGAKHSFLCPGGSVFNQRYLVCDWWYSADCFDAPRLYTDQHFLQESYRLQQSQEFAEPVNEVFDTEQNNLVYPQNDIFHGAETGVPNRDRFENTYYNNTSEQEIEKQNNQEVVSSVVDSLMTSNRQGDSSEKTKIKNNENKFQSENKRVRKKQNHGNTEQRFHEPQGLPVTTRHNAQFVSTFESFTEANPIHFYAESSNNVQNYQLTLTTVPINT